MSVNRHIMWSKLTTCRYGCKYKGEICRYGPDLLSTGFRESLRRCMLANNKPILAPRLVEDDELSVVEIQSFQQFDNLKNKSLHKDDPHEAC